MYLRLTPCSLMYRTNGAKSLSQIMQAIFDTVAIVMILARARIRTGGGLINVLAKQGLAYYTYASVSFTL